MSSSSYRFSNYMTDASDDRYGALGEKLVVEARDTKTDAVVGRGVFRIDNQNGAKNIVPVYVEVEQPHRRRGVATALGKHAEKVSGLKIRQEGLLTAEAKALWDSFRSR